MDKQIRVGIVGYGNLGRGVALAINKNPDMKLVAVFSRRSPENIVSAVEHAKILHVSEAENYKTDIDVMILCGGSATDLPEQSPYFARMFNTVDSFDTHSRIPEHFTAVNNAAADGNNLSIISAGWDPGLFSLNRMMSEAILPCGTTYTFWGKGVSQGHSDAIRRIPGVLGAVQYTVPIEEAVDKVRSGAQPLLTTREKHVRDCYVVVEDGTDKTEIEEKIKTMPNYFADYETRVTFITAQELKDKHSGMPHGGFVIRSGSTTSVETMDVPEGEPQHRHIVEYSIKLDSNPEFTGSVLVACARAVYRMRQDGRTGAITMLDVPPAYFSIKTPEELRKIIFRKALAIVEEGII